MLLPAVMVSAPRYGRQLKTLKPRSGQLHHFVQFLLQQSARRQFSQVRRNFDPVLAWLQ